MCFIFFELIVLSPTVSVINLTDKGQKVPTSKIVVSCCAQQLLNRNLLQFGKKEFCKLICFVYPTGKWTGVVW